jgi:hypothetical protein
VHNTSLEPTPWDSGAFPDTPRPARLSFALEDMSTELLGYTLIGLFAAFCVAGVVSWCFAAFYMFKTLAGFRPDRTWGRYIAVSLFMPWFFTEEGNRYRVKLLRSATLFIVFVVCGLGAGFLVENLKPKGTTQDERTASEKMSSNPSFNRTR